MPQYDFGTIDPYVVDGVQLAGMLNQWRDATYSKHRGPALPAYAQAGFDWINDSAGTAGWVWGLYVGATRGTLPMFSIDTVAGTMALASAMRAVTNASPTDASKQVATNEFVQQAISAAIAASVAALLPVGTLLDLVGKLTVAPSGWVLARQGTIGSASSGATIRANADCQALFSHLWTLPNTVAPVLPGGRGPDAASDWNLNKTIGGLDTRGLVRATSDDQGGTAAGNLSGFVAGTISGAQSVTLTSSQIPEHYHGVMGGNGLPQVGNTGRAAFGDGNAASYFQSGGNSIYGAVGGAHTNVQPTRAVTTLIKL